MTDACTLHNGGSAPATPGFNAVAPEWRFGGAADPAPAVPAAESALGLRPRIALSSAQVLPEWINRNTAANAFALNGDNPLNFVSHPRGSVQTLTLLRLLRSCRTLQYLHADSSPISLHQASWRPSALAV